MAYFYGYRIVNGVINPKTGEPWTIEDVPARYVPATEQWIEEHTNNN